MSVVDGGQVLVKAMQSFGVSTVFTLHGGHLESAYYAAVAAGIRLVDTRHEQAAGLAAMGWARATGNVGVAMVTAGGGVTNIVTAVANAYVDCVAMVIIGGAPPLRDIDALPVNSGYEQLSVMRGITKWACSVTHIELLPEMVARAFRLAREGRPGPVYLEIPSDVMFARIDDDALSYPNGALRVSRAAPTHEAISQALQLLKSAQRPVILAGGGIVYSGAADSLLAFAERSGIPVLTNNKSRGVVPTNHRLWGRGFSSIAANAARGGGSPDVVLILGARLGLYTGGRRTSVIPDSASVIQVDIRSEEIGRLRDIQLGITADCSEMLVALLDGDTDHAWPDWSEWASTLVPQPTKIAEQAPKHGETGAHISPAQLAAHLAAAAPPQSILVTDGGETPAWLDAEAHSLEPNHWLGHGYLGIMGEGLPLAVGVQIARPEARVICLTGDGAIGFNFAEFDTMVRHNLPIVVVVNNDAQWSMSAHGQDLVYGQGNRVVSELRQTRYDLAAQAFGAYSEHVEHIDQLAPAIDRALKSNRPACINVFTRPQSIAPVTQRFVGLAAKGLVGDSGLSRVPYADVLEV